MGRVKGTNRKSRSCAKPQAWRAEEKAVALDKELPDSSLGLKVKNETVWQGGELGN